MRYFDFMRGQAATIREVLKVSTEEVESTYFEVTLEETDEIIKLFVSPENAAQIKEGVKISYAGPNGIGCCFWKNGKGPFEIKNTEGE